MNYGTIRGTKTVVGKVLSSRHQGEYLKSMVIAIILSFSLSACGSSAGDTSYGIEQFCFGYRNQNVDQMNTGLEVLRSTGKSMDAQVVATFLDAVDGDVDAIEVVWSMCESRWD